MRAAADDEGVFGRPVGDIMTRDVIVGMPQDDVLAVAHTMLEKRFRHLPIVDEGRLIGIISICLLYTSSIQCLGRWTE